MFTVRKVYHFTSYLCHRLAGSLNTLTLMSQSRLTKRDTKWYRTVAGFHASSQEILAPCNPDTQSSFFVHFAVSDKIDHPDLPAYLLLSFR